MPSVNECQSSPQLSEEMGCEHLKQIVALDGRVIGDMPVQSVKVGETSFKWFRHPALFITPSVRMWLKEYDYYNGNHSVIPYHKRHSAWVECLETFEYYLRLFNSVEKYS